MLAAGCLAGQPAVFSARAGGATLRELPISESRSFI
jgi:hypothetical protein